MQRRRSVPHTFEDNIAAEKAKLAAQLATLKPGPQLEALRKKNQAARDRFPPERVAFLAGFAIPELT